MKGYYKIKVQILTVMALRIPQSRKAIWRSALNKERRKMTLIRGKKGIKKKT